MTFTPGIFADLCCCARMKASSSSLPLQKYEACPRAAADTPADKEADYGRTLTLTMKAIFAPLPTTTMFCPERK